MPLKEPFQISSGTQTDRRILLIQVRDADGLTGWGEAVAAEQPNYSSETTDTCWLAIGSWVAPRVLGQSFQGPEQIAAALDRDFRGHNMAKAGVEMACWELEARRQDVSLSRLLGGTREYIEVGISIGIQDCPSQLVAKARQALEQGYRKIKIKIKPGADIEYLEAVRESLGDDAPLMADANNAYTPSDLDCLKQLDRFGLIMIEQPLAWDDMRRHSCLQKELRTPVCLDESITSLERAEDMIALQSGRIINIKPGRVGGFSSSKAIHDLCQSRGIPVWCGGMLESGVGRAHNVALASLPNFTLPGDVSPSSRYWERDIVTPEWSMDPQGRVTVPIDRPGMGVQVDLDRVDNLTVKRQVISGD